MDAGIMLHRWMQSCPDLTAVDKCEMLTPVGPWKTGGYTDSESPHRKEIEYIHSYYLIYRQCARRNAALTHDRDVDAAKYEGLSRASPLKWDEQSY